MKKEKMTIKDFREIMKLEDAKWKPMGDSIELIDNLLPNGLKELVLPILEDSSIEHKLYRYGDEFLHKIDNETDSFSLEIDKKLSKYSKLVLDNENRNGYFFFNLVKNPDIKNILKISLIYEIGKNKDIDYLSLVKDNLETNFLTIKETAKWSFDQFMKKV